MSPLPTLVFIPGSWHKPTCYTKIIGPLESDYHLTCTSVTLPSTQGDPSATFHDDLQAARTVVTSETSQGRDVIVIAHSYGGMIGNSAIKGLSTPTSVDSGRVIGLILIASGFTFTGLSFMDPFFGRPPPSWRANWESGFAEFVTSPRELFYHDVHTDEEAEYWVSELTTQSLKALFEGGEDSYAGWKDVPVWYLGTVEDKGLPVAVQRLAVGAARQMGARVEHRELATSHSPFLSKPIETVGVVVDAVEAFTGRKLDEKEERKVGAGAVVPAFRLFQPTTWYRFGLPLVFGHALGSGMMVFGWCKRFLGFHSYL